MVEPCIPLITSRTLYDVTDNTGARKQSAHSWEWVGVVCACMHACVRQRANQEGWRNLLGPILCEC